MVWAYRAEANYWSRWALIQLLPSGLTTAERTWGAWKAERRAGRGSGTLQLSLRWGDAPLLDGGGVGVLTGDHSYTFNRSPEVHCGEMTPRDLPWACRVRVWLSPRSSHRWGWKCWSRKPAASAQPPGVWWRGSSPSQQWVSPKKPQGNTSRGDRERLNLLW